MGVALSVGGFVIRSLVTRQARKRVYTRMVGRGSARSTTGYRARMARPGGKTAYRYNKSYHQYRGKKGRTKKRGKSYGLKQAKDTPDETPRTLVGSISHGKGSKYTIAGRTYRKYRKEVAKRNTSNSSMYLRKRRRIRWIQ